MKYLNYLTGIVLLMFGLAWFGSAAAQSQSESSAYPSKPVRLLVGFSPGGSNDIVARVMADEMTKRLGQTIIVDNRPGASGRIANAIAADANPDGHTILLVPVSFALDVARGAKLPYQPDKAFSPVGLLASAPFVLVVNPNVPVQSTEELIKLARSQPGKLNVAHTGIGNLTHVLAEMFKSLANVDIVSVAYKGGGPALIDVVSGQVQMIFTGMPPALPHVNSGRVKLLAVTSGERTPLMPKVQTIAEAGVPGYEAYGWWGMLAPAGTPHAIVNKLNSVANQSLRQTSVKDRFSALGANAIGGTSVKFSEFITAEIKKWTAVMRKSGISDL